jgi:hypothetical protein
MFLIKTKVQRKILNTYISTQFLMLIPDTSLILPQSAAFIIPSYQLPAKKTQNLTLETMHASSLPKICYPSI